MVILRRPLRTLGRVNIYIRDWSELLIYHWFERSCHAVIVKSHMGGGGQFHTFKSHSYVHNRIIQEKNLHSIPHPSHAYAPRTCSNMNDSYSNT